MSERSLTLVPAVRQLGWLSALLFAGGALGLVLAASRDDHPVVLVVAVLGALLIFSALGSFFTRKKQADYHELRPPPVGAVTERPARTAARAALFLSPLVLLAVAWTWWFGAAAGLLPVLLGAALQNARTVRRLRRYERQAGRRLLHPASWVPRGASTAAYAEPRPVTDGAEPTPGS